MCFVLSESLSFFVFWWNFNAIAASTAAAPYIPLSAAATLVVLDIRYFLLYCPYLFTIQLTFLP
jgi:hypothetical protein